MAAAAAVSSPATSSLFCRRLLLLPPPPSTLSRLVPSVNSSSSLTELSNSLRLRRWISRNPRSCHLHAASAGPPPPENPFGKDTNDLAGVQEIASRIQDRVRVFLAVLLWMSLFFWSSAWDGRDNDKRKKGPPFIK